MEFSYAEYAPIFKALSDETRIKIIHMLSKKVLCACDILESVNISQSTLSYHMKQLSDCQLVDAKKVGSWMHYSLNKERAMIVATFMKDLTDSKPSTAMSQECEC